MMDILPNTNYDKTYVDNGTNKGNQLNNPEVELFISYAPSDYETASQICRVLGQRYMCYCLAPEDLNDTWKNHKEDIEKAINRCQYFIPLFSFNYFIENSEFIKWQLKKAKETANVLPVFVDHLKWDDIPKEQTVNCDDSFDLIVDSLRLKEYGISAKAVRVKDLSLPFYGMGARNHTEDIGEHLFEYIYDSFNRAALEPSQDHTELLQTRNTVFISYAHIDQDLVKAVSEKLMAQYDCWWLDAEKLKNWKNFEGPIYRAINSCKIFVAFFSKNYFNSEYCCDNELSRACALKKNIIPVFLDQTTPEQLATSKDHIKNTIIKLLEVEPIGYEKGFVKGQETQICESIINTTAFKLLNLWENGLPGIIHQVEPKSECVLNKLVLHLERQKKQVGNYITTQTISSDLFPLLKKIEKHDAASNDNSEDAVEREKVHTLDRLSSLDQKENKYGYLLRNSVTYRTPLVDCLNASKHLFLVGEGGLGKTTTLVETCRWLLSAGEYAVYIPLKELNGHNSLEQYFERTVFEGNSQMYKLALSIMNGNRPFYVFLDGLNEMPSDFVGTFISNLRKGFVLGGKAVKLIISSRVDSLNEFHESKNEFSHFKFQGLDRKRIESYIEKHGLSRVESDDMLHLLHTPLMLTLYCDSEEAKVQYEQDPNVRGKIELESNPNTAAKILKNFVQTQLYRALMENTYDMSVHATLYEYVLPSIAMKMVRNHRLSLLNEDFRNCIVNPARYPEQSKYFYTYEDLMDDKGLAVRYKKETAGCAKDIAQKQLAFVAPDEHGYAFTHQVFCDFFAAKFLCLEMEVCKGIDVTNNAHNLELCAMQYSEDILSFVADIQEENKFTPQREKQTGHWYNIEEDSLIEKIMTRWRNCEGALAQTAVYNLFNALRLGRNGNLFSCDFSSLDLRACNLNGVIFSEFDRNGTYASSFANAWIDKECFVQGGHSARVTALCISKDDNTLYSADASGKIVRWNMNEFTVGKSIIPVAEYAVVDDKIARLALSVDEKILLILTPHSVTVFNLVNEIIDKSYTVPPHKYLRDVRCNSMSTIEVTYDTAPLNWQALLDGDKNGVCHEEKTITGPVAGNLSVSPVSTAEDPIYVYSTLNGIVRTSQKHSCSLHNHLKEIINNARSAGMVHPYYELRNNPQVNDISWHFSGKKVLVAYSNTVFELEYTSEHKLRYISHIALESVVTAVSYRTKAGQDNVVICGAFGIRVFEFDAQNKRWDDSGCVFSRRYIPGIKKVLQGDLWTYLLSSNKELKIFDEKLNLLYVRQLNSDVDDFCFAQGINSNEKFICVLMKSRERTYCAKYDVCNDSYEDIGFQFRLIFDDDDHSDKPYTHYIVGKRLISIRRDDPQRIIYENTAGHYIQRCSFKDVRGNVTKEYMPYILRNGGSG